VTADPSQTTSQFDRDTAVSAVAGEDGGWTADLSPSWNIGRNPNGGYLLAIAARAMQQAAGRPHPMSVTAHYLSPPTSDEPVTISTEIVKAGRRYVNVGARMTQAGRERIRLVGIYGDLDGQEGPTQIAARPPRIADPDRCVSLVELTEKAGRVIPESVHRFDLLLPPDTPWGRAGESEPFEITGWIRLADGSPPDPLSLLTFADAYPPTLLGSVAHGWVPTLELTVHVRGRPAPGWLLGTFRTRFLMDGVLEEDGELWDADRRPVALSRQLALVLGS
jgi:acyl-CoA thioesterase